MAQLLNAATTGLGFRPMPVQYRQASCHKTTMIIVRLMWLELHEQCEIPRRESQKPLIQCEYAHAMLGNHRWIWSKLRYWTTRHEPKYQGGFIWIRRPGLALPGSPEGQPPAVAALAMPSTLDQHLLLRHGVLAADRPWHPTPTGNRQQHQSICHHASRPEEGGNAGCETLLAGFFAFSPTDSLGDHIGRTPVLERHVIVEHLDGSAARCRTRQMTWVQAGSAPGQRCSPLPATRQLRIQGLLGALQSSCRLIDAAQGQPGGRFTTPPL